MPNDQLADLGMPTVPNAPANAGWRTIERWTTEYHLRADELQALEEALQRSTDAEAARELEAELQSILAGREIAAMTLPTKADLAAIRAAFAAGWAPTADDLKRPN